MSNAQATPTTPNPVAPPAASDEAKGVGRFDGLVEQAPSPDGLGQSATIPSVWDTKAFLERAHEKEIKFSRRDPVLWRELLAISNPQTLTVCRHLEGEVEDKACRCGYPGSVWADPERVLFTMGDVWGDDASMQTPRIERNTEIATAQLITCLYNNADWLIGLAAEAIETRRAETLDSVADESASPQECAR